MTAVNAKQFLPTHSVLAERGNGISSYPAVVERTHSVLHTAASSPPDGRESPRPRCFYEWLICAGSQSAGRPGRRSVVAGGRPAQCRRPGRRGAGTVTGGGMRRGTAVSSSSPTGGCYDNCVSCRSLWAVLGEQSRARRARLQRASVVSILTNFNHYGCMDFTTVY